MKYDKDILIEIVSSSFTLSEVARKLNLNPTKGNRDTIKKYIKIPKSIINNQGFAKRCVAGIIDTDFNITENMSISGKLHSLKLVKEISKILEKNNIQHILRTYPDYGRFYIRKESAIKWLRTKERSV